MEKITINEALQMLSDLEKDDQKRFIVIKTESIFVWDTLKEYAKQNDAFLYRDCSYNPVEPYHKVLLNAVFGDFGQNYIKEDINLYRGKINSMVFVDYNPNEESETLKGFEYYSCFNPDALKVADFIDKLTEMNDNDSIAVITSYRNRYIKEFVSPYMDQSKGLVTIRCYKGSPYKVGRIIDVLSKLDASSYVDIPVEMLANYAHDITLFEKHDSNEGQIGLVEIECIDPISHIEIWHTRKK